jgi:hypothetical protein
MLQKAIKVQAPSRTHREQTIPKAKTNLPETGRFLSQAMPEALSLVIR